MSPRYPNGLPASARHYLAAVPVVVPGVTVAADVRSKKLQWLWTDHIPLGALSEIIADEGLGKSTLAARIIGDTTNGQLPGQDGVPSNVLVIAEEDGRPDVLVPRLQAAGTDMSRVGFLQVPDGDGFRSVEFPRDAAFVAEQMAAFDARLLVTDPLGSHVKVKSSLETDAVRRALAPLAKAAADGGWAGLGIRHTNRSLGTNARNRSGGSVAYRQTARIQLVFGRDPDAPGDDWSRMLVGSKGNNVGWTGGTRIHLSLVPVQLDDGNEDVIICARFGAVTSHGETDVLKATNESVDVPRGRPPKKIVNAEDFISETLGDGKWMRATVFLALAAENDIKPTTLKRARKEMGVKTKRKNNRLWVCLSRR